MNSPNPADRDSGVGQISYLRVGGQRLRVSVAGDGPPLLLINGIGANIEMWSPLRSLLSARTTIAFDAPGTGGSSTPRRPIRMRGLSRIVAQLLDQLGYPRVDIFGFSFGGMIAQQFAHDYAVRVDRLVLAATTPGLGGVLGDPRAMRIIATSRRYRDPNYLTQVASILYGGRVGRDPAALHDQQAARVARPPTSVGYAWQLSATMGWSSLRWLHRVQHPTLVLGGEEDPITPPVNARIIANSMPRGRFEVLPRAGHLFPLDSAELVAPLVLDWTAAHQSVCAPTDPLDREGG